MTIIMKMSNPIITYLILCLSNVNKTDKIQDFPACKEALFFSWE